MLQRQTQHAGLTGLATKAGFLDLLALKHYQNE